MNLTNHLIQLGNLEMRFGRYMTACEYVDELPFIDRLAITKLYEVASRLLKDMRAERNCLRADMGRYRGAKCNELLRGSYSTLLSRIGQLRMHMIAKKPYLCFS